MKWILLSFFVSVWVFASDLREVPLQVTDSLDKIEVYVLQEKWSKAILSLKDVAETSLNRKRYRELLERAAIGYVRDENSNISSAESLADQLSKNFPSLQTSRLFQSERDRVSQLVFSLCFDHNEGVEECLLRLISRLEKDPERVSFMLWASTQLYVRQWADLSYQLFRIGATSKAQKMFCASASLLHVTVNNLSEKPPYNENFLKLVKENCWKELQGKLAKEIANQSNKLFVVNACDLFKTMKTKHAKCSF